MAFGMNCPNCGLAAGADASYCVSCGSRLSTVCPNCRAASPADSRFCSACGSPLAGGTQAAPPPVQDVTCPRCRAANGPGATFCYACGLPLDEPGMRPAAQSVAGGIPAGFWIRLLAWFIDSVVLFIVQMILIAVLPGISLEEYFADDSFWTSYDSFLTLVGVIYYTAGVSVWATTIGKRMLGLYVLRPDGSKLGPGRAFARYWAPLLSALILFIGFLMVAFREDKRALHDLICDTVVVKR